MAGMGKSENRPDQIDKQGADKEGLVGQDEECGLYSKYSVGH